MKALTRLARHMEHHIDPTLGYQENCYLIDHAIPDHRQPVNLNTQDYDQLVAHMLSCLDVYRKMSIIRVDLVLPYGGIYPDNQPIDRFLMALIRETAQYCERHGCENLGFHYAHKRVIDELGVERYRVILYVPQSTTLDAGFYHPTLDNYARAISDSWMQAIGTEERTLCTNLPPTLELRDSTSRMVSDYQRARRMLYELAECTLIPMTYHGQLLRLSTII